jgi:hypothetical protein
VSLNHTEIPNVILIIPFLGNDLFKSTVFQFLGWTLASGWMITGSIHTGGVLIKCNSVITSTTWQNKYKPIENWKKNRFSYHLNLSWRDDRMWNPAVMRFKRNAHKVWSETIKSGDKCQKKEYIDGHMDLKYGAQEQGGWIWLRIQSLYGALRWE